MKRKIVIIVSIILILIMVSLYYTYATNVTMEQTSGNADLTFNINLTEEISRTITVEAGKTKYFDIFVTNTNEVTINYGLMYNNIENANITVAQVHNSKNGASDLIDSNTTYQISLVIKNDSESSITYDISPVVGYANGGDLIVPSNHTLITDVYNIKTNAISGTVSDWVIGTGSGSSQSKKEEPNSPDLVDGLIPVMYSNDTWVKADSTNSNEAYKWYDYDNKMWANAVLVTSTNRDNYKTADVGTPITDDDILAFYVWIPRYKYRVWNINKEVGVDSYDAENLGINVVFEKEKETTGTITCEYDFTVLEGMSETCTGRNGDYYTHPAFTFGDDELRGLWVGKFEISSSSPTYRWGGGDDINLNVRIKPSITSWRGLYVDIGSYVVQNMQKSSNEYGLTIDRQVADSHMIKNTEWGLVSYFTHSKYGRCSGGKCSQVSPNSYSSGKGLTLVLQTGCGPQSEGSTSSGSICNEYTSSLGMTASTTGNIYGIYDMAEGGFEYVMGNVSNEAGSYVYNIGYVGSNYIYSEDTAKYIDTYAYFVTYASTRNFYGCRLGDATMEIKDWNNISINILDKNDPWFGRGSSMILSLGSTNGSGGSSSTTRAILVDLN